MARFKLLASVHVDLAGNRYQAGTDKDIVTSDEDLCVKFPNRFERLHEDRLPASVAPVAAPVVAPAPAPVDAPPAPNAAEPGPQPPIVPPLKDVTDQFAEECGDMFNVAKDGNKYLVMRRDAPGVPINTTTITTKAGVFKFIEEYTSTK